MKIRTFTVGLLASVMLSASLISCAIPPAFPTLLTPLATQTPTLVIPSQTPLPTETPSPESQLPKKYTQVEINQMTDEEKFTVAPEIEGYAKWKSAERFVIYEGQDGIKNLAFDLTKAEKREIKQYPSCKIDKFYDCVIPFEELKNGDYWLWLNTLSQPFDPSKVKDVPLTTNTFMDVVQKTEIIYDTSKGPNFNDPATAPFRRDVTFGIVNYEYDGNLSYGAIKPIEFYDKNNPNNNKWIVTIDSYYYASHKNISPQTSQYLQWNIDTWKYWMNITPILTATLSTQTGGEDPLVKNTFELYPDIHARFEKFLKGDVSVLSGPDIFLLTNTVRDTGNTYK